MRVCIGQINTTPGDFAGNFHKISAGIDAAVADRANLLVFPELTIPGYLGQDLIYHKGYVERNLDYLDKVRQLTGSHCPDLAVVVGYLDHNPKARGKPYVNCAAVVRNGQIEETYTKQLLPFYDVFDELRYFEPGDKPVTFVVGGETLGLVICEDLWNDKGADGYSYSDNPLTRYQSLGVQTIVSLNSSPYIANKLWSRISTIGEHMGSETSVIYVNQVGGQDELVFDGQSFVLRRGDLIYLSNELGSDCCETIDFEAQPVLKSGVSSATNRSWVLDQACSLHDLLVLGLRDYTVKSGFESLVLASSGGVDSAVVCMLAAEAVGPDRVHAIRMPSMFSSQHSRDDALELHQRLGCWDYLVPLDHLPMVDMLSRHYAVHAQAAENLVTQALENDGYNRIADENIQARLRDLYVMHFSNAYGAMPLSTGNKTESACGYYTHFDMNFSYAPIKDLYKFQVTDLARAASGIPANIWKKAPSAELAPDQIDEQSLLPYAVLDPIVKSHIEDYISLYADFVGWVDTKLADPGRHDKVTSDPDRISAWMAGARAADDYSRIIRLIGRMEYKRRQTCPGTKVSKVAFGIGRRIPIVEKWN